MFRAEKLASLSDLEGVRVEGMGISKELEARFERSWEI
jgi:hypothetical protein